MKNRTMATESNQMNRNTVKEEKETCAVSAQAKNIAVISYLTLIGFIVALVMNNDKKAAFSTYHIKQSLGLALTGLALGMVGAIPILGWIVSFIGSLGLLYLWIMGLINALNKKQIPVPWIGLKYEEWFEKLNI